MHLSLPRFEAPECVVVGGLLTYFLCAQNSCRECLNGSPRGLLFSFFLLLRISLALIQKFCFLRKSREENKRVFSPFMALDVV